MNPETVSLFSAARVQLASLKDLVSDWDETVQLAAANYERDRLDLSEASDMMREGWFGLDGELATAVDAVNAVCRALDTEADR